MRIEMAQRSFPLGTLPDQEQRGENMQRIFAVWIGGDHRGDYYKAIVRLYVLYKGRENFLIV